MRLVGHQRHLLAIEGDADQPRGAAGLDQPRDGPVVVAGAIADAMAAPVEGGERHQHQRRVEHFRLYAGPDACRNPCRPAARRAPARGRRSSSCRGWQAGRAARLFRARQTSAAAHRPRSASARSRRRSRRARSPAMLAASAMPSEASMRQNASRRRGGRAPPGAAAFSGIWGVHARDDSEALPRTAARKRRFRRMERTARYRRCLRKEVTIHTTGGEVDPGNLQSRWAPYERTHGSGQGQLPRDQ